MPRHRSGSREMARRWSARLARVLVALALVTCAGGVREPRARGRLASPRIEVSDPARTFGNANVLGSGGSSLSAPPVRRAPYDHTESQRFVFLAGAAYCDAGLESWTCPYCNDTSLVDVRVTTGAKNMRGYVGWDLERGVAVVAFRGTEPNSLENWLENLDAHHTSWQLPPEPGSIVPPPPLRVHAGFLDSWKELRADTFAALSDIQLNRFKSKNAPLPVVVTGHSLGGALATLCALELAAAGYYVETGYAEYPGSEGSEVGHEGPDVVSEGHALKDSLSEDEESFFVTKPPPPPPPVRVRADVRGVRTFGSPRVGDILFAAAYESVLGQKTWRVTHAHDVVPSVPPRLVGFHHVPTEVFYRPEVRVYFIFQSDDDSFSLHHCLLCGG